MIAYRVHYTFTRMCTRAIPNGHPREEKRACRTSRRGSSCVYGSWQAERAAARRLPREDPCAEVGEDVRVGVGPMEFKLYTVGYYLIACFGACTFCLLIT